MLDGFPCPGGVDAPKAAPMLRPQATGYPAFRLDGGFGDVLLPAAGETVLAGEDPDDKRENDRNHVVSCCW